MARGVPLSWIVVLTITTASSLVRCSYYSHSAPYEPPKLKKTRLRFFLHDTLSGKNPTAVIVARANDAPKSDDPTPFGTAFAIDDPLTEGPEITSKVVGNAKGLYLSSSRDKNLTLVMYVDLGFTTGKFKGSSLSVFSRNPVTEADREMAVVGGRGKFRMARGFIKVKTNYLNITNGDAVLEYKASVVHPWS